MAGDDAGDDVGELDVRVDAVELAGLDERGDPRPMFDAAIGAGEEGILPIERNGADRAFDDVGVDFDAAVVEEAAEPCRAHKRVADRLGQLALLADQRKLPA